MTASGEPPMRVTVSSTNFKSTAMRLSPESEIRTIAATTEHKELKEPKNVSLCSLSSVVAIRKLCKRPPNAKSSTNFQSLTSDFGIRISFGSRVSAFGFHIYFPAPIFPVDVPMHHKLLTPRRIILSWANAGLAWKESPISIRASCLNSRATSTTIAAPFWLNR